MTMHKLYLDSFIDMCNGEIISLSIDKHPTAQNVLVALEQAIAVTSDCPYCRTFHSDRGWAYQMKAYPNCLKKERIFQSMSWKGNCHDNSNIENFFGLLKQEIYNGVIYYSYEEMKSEIEQYIKYYNEQRITRMDESCAIQAYPLDYIKNSVAAIKLLTKTGHQKKNMN